MDRDNFLEEKSQDILKSLRATVREFSKDCSSKEVLRDSPQVSSGKPDCTDEEKVEKLIDFVKKRKGAEADWLEKLTPSSLRSLAK